jgi:hypothetical protein
MQLSDGLFISTQEKLSFTLKSIGSMSLSMYGFELCTILLPLLMGLYEATVRLELVALVVQ